MLKITDEVLKSLEEYKNNLQQFKEGIIKEFKPFSAFMGIYEESNKETYMIRPRIPGGVVELEQLKAINEIAKKYGEGKVRFTTRQDFQFHSVKLDNLALALEELIKADLTTKGAGGNSVRNIACSPLSGVSQDEVFDVTPYVKEVSNYMLIDPANLVLPRKYKVSFSNSPADTVNATISDIGFIAKIVDGKRGFEVYAGGGLGGGARLAIKLEDFIEDTDALYYVQAMKQVFEREGDRANRHRARLRFVLQRLGEEEFVKVFKAELEKLKAEKDLKLNIELKEDTRSNKDNKADFDNKYKNVVLPQKQEGYYSVYIHPQNGNLTTDSLDKILDYITSLDYEVSLRLTMTQGMYVRDLQGKDVQKLVDIIADFSSVYNVEGSITCAGPTICNYGINNSQGLLTDIAAAIKDKSEEVKDALPRIFISGCMNSCGQHQRGLIGLTGKRKRTDDGAVPVYAVSFNGSVGVGEARFGVVYGDIAAKKIPSFVVELAELKVNSGYVDFVDFIVNKEAEVRELVTKYSTLESLAENPDLYVDYK
ncbi:MAG: nitrite/sulfite reductase [Clostridiaceae bacterium]